MDVKLTVVGGKASKANVALKLPTVIGRSREAGLTVAHPMVSRRHCEVYEADGLLMIRDLGSLNGTFVGGQRVKESPLPPDAEFTIGPLTFRAQYAYEGDQVTVPAAVLDGEAAAAPSTASKTVVSALQTVQTSPDALDAAVTKPAVADESIDDEDIVEFLTVLGTGVDEGEEPQEEPQPEEEAEPTPPSKLADTPKANSQPGKAKSKGEPAADPAELPDDLFDELLN